VDFYPLLRRLAALRQHRPRLGETPCLAQAVGARDRRSVSIPSISAGSRRKPSQASFGQTPRQDRMTVASRLRGCDGKQNSERLISSTSGDGIENHSQVVFPPQCRQRRDEKDGGPRRAPARRRTPPRPAVPHPPPPTPP